METSMNKVMLIGNITQDLIVKSNDRATWVKMIVAVDRNKEESDFFKTVAFGKTADYLAKYATKGSKIGVEGRLTSDKYLDPKTNTNVYTVEVIIEKVWILNRKESISSEVVDELRSVSKAIEAAEDDLPF